MTNPPDTESHSSAPPVHHAHSENAPEVRPVPARRIRLGLVVIIAILVVAFIVGTVPRISTKRALAEQTNVDQTPLVAVTHVKRAAPASDLLLPGTLEPLHQAAIYARSSGYVKHWYADIGRQVHAGERLADIEVPDLDQQLAQSKAVLEQAKSARSLASVEKKRWEAMFKDSVVTEDEYDQKVQAEEAAVAMVNADQADVYRLAALQGFEQVTAPFAGVVTARNVDNGSFVQATGGSGAALPSSSATSPTALFQMAQTDTVRIYISVPQVYATSIVPNQAADVHVREFPAQTFVGHVARTAQAVDPNSRTLLTEVQIVNPKRVLLPGMFAQIRFIFERATPPLIIPANAIVALPDGIQVVEVGPDNRVRHIKVDIARDYGAYVEVADGVTDGTTLVVNPPAELVDGTHVKVLAEPNPKETAPARN
jgi:membrane fusion protein, multidrug efflux system